MVCSKLHIICGNCGNYLNIKQENNEIEIQHKKDEPLDVWIYCSNCNTLHSLKDYIKKLYYLSNLKIRKQYNCTKKQFEKNIITYLLNNANCHLVSIFKERMLTDFVDEFLRRQYSYEESSERIPKFAIYYKNYLLFFDIFLYHDNYKKF